MGTICKGAKDMKKILFYIYSLNKGGAERVLLTLAEKLSKTYEVVILTDVYDEREYSLPSSIRRIDLGHYMEKMPKIKIGLLKRLLAIRKCCKIEAPDKIIAFMASSSIRAVLANIFTGRKVIVTIRSNPYDDYGKRIKRFWLHTVFSLAEKIVCQTPYQTEFFCKQLQKKCVVIANPLFSDFYLPAYEGEREKKIVTAGRLYDYKNHKLLIRAFAKIAKEFPDYKVIILGEGPYREELEKEIEYCDLVGRVLLPGDSPHVAEDIYKATLFVLPSDTEGMPNALMEAMSLGLAVIATDCPCGGPRSLITHGMNGMLCEVGNVEDLAEQMRTVLGNFALQKNLGKNALLIREECHVDRISEKWSQLIDGK